MPHKKHDRRIRNDTYIMTFCVQAFANRKDTIVLELRANVVLKYCRDDARIAARFWFCLCKALDSAVIEVCCNEM